MQKIPASPRDAGDVTLRCSEKSREDEANKGVTFIFVVLGGQWEGC